MKYPLLTLQLQGFSSGLSSFEKALNRGAPEQLLIELPNKHIKEEKGNYYPFN
jgi:hypothetical protein